MTESTSKQEIENDELVCPITLQLFHDPVKAQDGHVYERRAITKWILEHGTSPFTRQPLKIDDLQPDDQLKNLAKQRRNSTVSFNSQNEQVILPPLRRIPRNHHRIAPAGIFNSRRINHPSNQNCCRLILGIILCVIIPTSVILAIIFIFKSVQVQIISNYSGALTSNSSKFNRLNSSNSAQDYFYNNISIGISQDGLYEFTSDSSIDLLAYFYVNSFNDTNVNSNLLISDDDSGKSNQFYFSYSLQSNLNYKLVVTTYNANITGTFIIYVKGPTTVQFN